MDFAIPPVPDADPADDWKKTQPNGEPHPHYDFGPQLLQHESGFTLPKYGLPPLPFLLASDLANRFAELGFDPDTIKDKQTFGFLFIAQENCLMITRKAAEKEPTYYISAHRFLERKKK